MQRLFAFIIFLLLPSTAWATETVPLNFFTQYQLKMPEVQISDVVLSGMTIDKWRAASGSGMYTVKVEQVDLSVSFEKLIPSSMYSIVCSRITLPPNETRNDFPCGTSDDTKNSFRSDNRGNGTLHMSLVSPLPESSEDAATALLLLYENKKLQYAHMYAFLPTHEIITAPLNQNKSTKQWPSVWKIICVGVSIFTVAVWWIVRKPLSGQGDDFIP